MDVLGICVELKRDPAIAEKSAIAMYRAKKVIWDPVMIQLSDPRMCFVTRSVTHGRDMLGMPGPAYVYYYDDQTKARNAPARVDGRSKPVSFQHVNYATYLALTRRGR